MIGGYSSRPRQPLDLWILPLRTGLTGKVSQRDMGQLCRDICESRSTLTLPRRYHPARNEQLTHWLQFVHEETFSKPGERCDLQSSISKQHSAASRCGCEGPLGSAMISSNALRSSLSIQYICWPDLENNLRPIVWTILFVLLLYFNIPRCYVHESAKQPISHSYQPTNLVHVHSIRRS